MSGSETTTRALALAALVSLVVGLYLLIPHIRAEKYTPVLTEPAAHEGETELIVTISGAVGYPGLYTLDASTSLAEVLRLAAADMDCASDSVAIAIASTDGAAEPQRVDLNHADAWLLDALPGIGPDKADAIVTYRELHGPFCVTDELTLVPGIGSATYEQLRELVTVTP